MKRLFYTILGLCFSVGLMAQTPRQNYEKLITETDLYKHLSYIASDELEGRDTGSEGQWKAAAYIVKHLEEWGLQPIVDTPEGKSYLQNFNLYKSGWGESFIEINNKRKVFFEDYFPSGMVYLPQATSYETVFVGYGIKDENYDDYAGKNVNGKAVVFLSGSPDKNNKEWNGFQGTRKKIKSASDLGAVAVFEIDSGDEESFNNTAAQRKAVMQRFSRLTIEKGAASAMTSLPSFTVSKAMGAEMIGAKLKKLNQYIDGKAKKLKTRKRNITVKSDRLEEPVKTANIMGFLEGTDKKDEVIVVSAHYDHVGVDEQGQIYNGADDDGSGTVAVMKMAEAFAKAKQDGHGLRRSVLFLWVTGEEKGLLGSSYFVDHDPVIPLKNIMCNLNIDMIGRVDKKHEGNPDYVYVIGSDKLSSELHAVSEKMNSESVNLELDYEFNDPKDPNRFYYRSDHYNFAKEPHKIPVIFYFTGVHEDYHQPGDTVDKILFPRYAKVTKLVFNTAWELGNLENRIVVDSNKP